MKRIILVLALCCGLCAVGYAQEKGNLLIDDFEDTVWNAELGTVDVGAGNGSSVKVSPAADQSKSGKFSMKVEFETVPGGHIYVARGYELAAKNSDWLVDPKTINWKDYKGLSFQMYGSDSKAKVAFDIKDNGNEMWRFVTEDNFKGWKQIVCPFDQFTARTDWQPENSDKNGVLDFPLKSFQFEPLPEAKGTLYFEDVELVKK